MKIWEAQGLLEVESSAILGLGHSIQSMSYPVLNDYVILLTMSFILFLCLLPSYLLMTNESKHLFISLMAISVSSFQICWHIEFYFIYFVLQIVRYIYISVRKEGSWGICNLNYSMSHCGWEAKARIRVKSAGFNTPLFHFNTDIVYAAFSKFAGILSAALSQHHLSGFEIAQLEFHHLH